MKLTENCAVVGVSTAEDDDVLSLLQEGLSALQHRGQESVGISVYKVQENLGRALAEKSGVEADMVVPVPDSGRSAATGYALASGIPLSARARG